ncbi:MAG: DUF819 family protein [Woeseiaceae bacterium]|nr:DUF819 family protein [Woeseiaceae bacterium]NIP20525.1 DUF819 family protein [Woeseiaceae bacterium]NIS89119.1 DUF819 family protein [Woeseiaceae bacterium]
MDEVLISSPIGVLAVLAFVAAFFFAIEQSTKAKLFQYLPPLLFIYATPVFLNNFDVIPSASAVYSGLSAYVLPAFIVLMLIKVNVPAVVRVMGKGVLVMLMGTAGVMVGAVIAYMIVHSWLSEDAWKGYGALAGSWIGGTANMAATAEMLGTSEEQFGLAVIADNVIYIVWLPLLLMSRDFAERFNRWARVPTERLEAMDAAAELHVEDDHAPTMPQYLFLVAVVIGVTWIGTSLAPGISGSIAENTPALSGIFGESTVRILLVTTIALILSATPVSKLPNSTAMGTAMIYVFVAGMGARASVEGLAEAPMFVAGAFIWITIHGLFCLAGAWLFRVDVHSVAIASAANIGAAASAPIVAAHHRPSLVPASILMALLGYAMGNYLAPMTGHLARIAVGQ